MVWDHFRSKDKMQFLPTVASKVNVTFGVKVSSERQTG